MHEFESLMQLLAMLLLDPRSGVLIVLLALAAAIDCRSFRIPNWLTFSGAVYGLIISAFALPSPWAAFADAAGGLALGFAVMLPLYLIRVMGAGDVKLMAMSGAFLGIDGVWRAIVCTFIVGGVLAVALAFTRGSLGRMLLNIKNIAATAAFSASAGMRPGFHVDTSDSVGKLPYGVSISIGTIGFMAAHQLGYL